MANESVIGGERAARRAFGRRILALALLMLMAFGVLLARMFQLQVIDQQIYSTRSEDNRLQFQPVPPLRGLIFDRHGELLAGNRPVFTVSIVRELVENEADTLESLRELLDLTDSEIRAYKSRQARRPHEPLPLRVGLGEVEMAQLAVNRYRLPGVKVTSDTVRHYPLGVLAAHAVGSVRRISAEDQGQLDEAAYVGTQFIGKRGIEATFEHVLHGSVGFQRAEVDAHGRVRRLLEMQSPVRGNNLTLHLDTRLQIAASAALGGRRGAVVAIEPSSGGILALVSDPGYDPNLFVTGMDPATYERMARSRDRPLFNRAISGQYAPGSTIKPAVGLAALYYGVTSWDRTVRDNGSFRIPGERRLYRDWSWKPNGSGGQGNVGLAKAIYRSSNVYFYTMAYELGVERLAPSLRQFGLGRNTALDIPDASTGLVPDPEWKMAHRGELWYAGDTVNMGIGQGAMLVTPLQVATMATVLANRGRFVAPRMVLAADAPLSSRDSAPVERAVEVTEADAERMVDAMEAVVHQVGGDRETGTAWAYIGRGLKYRMAGKSGTSQVVAIAQGEEYDADELPEHLRKHAWFIAFAPADAPQIAVAVLVENGGGGSSVAAPVARDVINAYLLPQRLAQR